MIFTKPFWKDALTRAIKTIAQTFLSMITVGQGLMDIDWVGVLSVSAVAGLLSIAMSIVQAKPGIIFEPNEEGENE